MNPESLTTNLVTSIVIMYSKISALSIPPSSHP